MCCCNNNFFNCRRQQSSLPVTVIQGAQGPIGPMGPQGPQGPQGLPGTSSISASVYGSNTSQSITTNSLATIALVSSYGTSYSLANNLVTVPAGTYLIQYTADASVPTDNAGLILTVGGANVTNSQSSVPSSGTIVNLGGQALVVLAVATTIGVTNNTTETETINNLSLSITKIA